MEIHTWVLFHNLRKGHYICNPASVYQLGCCTFQILGVELLPQKSFIQNFFHSLVEEGLGGQRAWDWTIYRQAREYILK